MAHKHFTMDDVILIEEYFHADIKTPQIVKGMGKKQPVYGVINFLKGDGNSREYWQLRKRIELCAEDEAHIEQFLRQDWTPDVICGHRAGCIPFIDFF